MYETEALTRGQLPSCGEGAWIYLVLHFLRSVLGFWRGGQATYLPVSHQMGGFTPIQQQCGKFDFVPAIQSPAIAFVLHTEEGFTWPQYWGNPTP